VVPANDGQVPLPLVAVSAAEVRATDYEECLSCQ
jgi:hypothetical protein